MTDQEITPQLDEELEKLRKENKDLRATMLAVLNTLAEIQNKDRIR